MTNETQEIDALALAGAKAKGKRPYFFDDPDVERVLSITMAVAGELAVLRQRLDSIESLLEERVGLTQKDIDEFVPNAAQEEARSRWYQEYLVRILRIVQQEREALARSEEITSEEAGNRLAND